MIVEKGGLVRPERAQSGAGGASIAGIFFFIKAEPPARARVAPGGANRSIVPGKTWSPLCPGVRGAGAAWPAGAGAGVEQSRRGASGVPFRNMETGRRCCAGKKGLFTR